MRIGLALLVVSVVVSGACSKSEPPVLAKDNTVALTVTAKGFEPTPVRVKAGQPVKLIITRKSEDTCATEIVLKDYNIQQTLPLGEPVTVAFTPTKTGEVKYACGMGMISGVLLVE
jgi:plastocyanin domain-containing protein